MRKGRTSLRQQLDCLTDAYVRAVTPLDESERRRHEPEQRDRALATREDHLAGEAERQQELAGVATSLAAVCQRTQRRLSGATFDQRRQLVMPLIDRVVVTDGEVEIRYVLPTTPASEHVRSCQLRQDYFHHPATRLDDEAAVGRLLS